MNELLSNAFLKISKESEELIGSLAIKILFYFNCGVISIYIGELLGYTVHNAEIAYHDLVQFISGLYVIIPVFLFLFTILATQLVARLFVTLSALLIANSAIVTLNQPAKRFLVKEKVITRNYEPGQAYPAYKATFSGQCDEADLVKLLMLYNSYVAVTTLFIYNIIVPERFPALFSIWINSVLWFFAVSIFAMAMYSEAVTNRNRELKNELAKVKEYPSEAVSAGGLSNG